MWCVAINFPVKNIIIVLKNFKEIGIKLPLLLSQLMERDVCFLPLQEQVSAPQGIEGEGEQSSSECV